MAKRNRIEELHCEAFAKRMGLLENLGQLTHPLLWKHNDNGQRAGKDTGARIRAGARAKRMGVQRGVPDYDFIWFDGSAKVGCMEFKAPDGKLTKEQRDYAAKCGMMGIPFAVVRTAEDGISVLKEWGAVL